MKEKTSMPEHRVPASQRILSLDYLRGLMAMSVMIYHYTVWGGLELHADSLLRKLGIYAVSIFFILSGLSLAIVYKERLSGGLDVAAFWIRRLYRIAPLYWLTVTAALMLAYIKMKVTGAAFEWNTWQVVLNYTMTFGFFAPDAYLTTGAWSIGNELVFYSLFPLIFLLARSRPALIGLVFFLSLCIGFYFAFARFDTSVSLADQWSIYINPFNQFFLFWAGVVCGTFFEAKPADCAGVGGGGGAVHSLTLVFLLWLFWWYPLQGSDLGLVTGANRAVLSLLCVAFVWVCYVHPGAAHLPKIAFLAFLGEGCYSIYLLHPLVGGVTAFALTKLLGLPVWFAYCFAAALTLVVAWLTFRLVERPMIDRGARLARRVAAKRGAPVL